MAAPMARHAVQLQVEGDLVSVPYVTMTARMMCAFGATVSGPATGPIDIAPTGYSGTNYEIEPDASAASYFWATAAISGGDVTVEGLTYASLQGDVNFCRVLERMGLSSHRRQQLATCSGWSTARGRCRHGRYQRHRSDVRGAVALFADGPTRVRGVAHNRHKETDRIADLARELRKFGGRVDEHDDGLTIWPATFETPETTLKPTTIIAWQ